MSYLYSTAPNYTTTNYAPTAHPYTYAYCHGYNQSIDQNLGYGPGIYPSMVTEEYGEKWREGDRKQRSSSARMGWPSIEGTFSEYAPGRAKADYWTDSGALAFIHCSDTFYDVGTQFSSVCSGVFACGSSDIPFIHFIQHSSKVGDTLRSTPYWPQIRRRFCMMSG